MEPWQRLIADLRRNQAGAEPEAPALVGWAVALLVPLVLYMALLLAMAYGVNSGSG